MKFGRKVKLRGKKGAKQQGEKFEPQLACYREDTPIEQIKQNY